MEITKGKFKDGYKGWKTKSYTPYLSCSEKFNIIFNDDEECICDCVYEKNDAQLITKAPLMYKQLKSIESYLGSKELNITSVEYGIWEKINNILTEIEKG